MNPKCYATNCPAEGINKIQAFGETRHYCKYHHVLIAYQFNQNDQKSETMKKYYKKPKRMNQK